MLAQVARDEKSGCAGIDGDRFAVADQRCGCVADVM
jgi:hypothetical protein